MKVTEIQAIDVHAHYGNYNRGRNSQVDQFMTADAETVVKRAKLANTVWSVVSPLKALLPRFQADVFAGNEEAVRCVAETDGLMQWVVVHPLKPSTYDQAARMLALPKCIGLKIHPEEHGYSIREQGRTIFEFAAKHQAVVLTHSGEGNSLPEDFVPFLNDFPEVRLILAHLGCTCDGDPSHQVRAIETSKHGNIYVDTSSAQSIMPNLIEWAVREVGAGHVLYGTDTPLYFAPMMRARIDHAAISDHEKRLILRDNAIALLGLSNEK